MDWQLVQLWRAYYLVSTRKSSVLALGESSFLFVSPEDKDQRRLAAMVGDAVGEDVAMVTLCGPGYDPRLYCEFIRLLSETKRRPRVVVVSICLRTSTSTHVQLNPRFGYERSRAVMVRLTSARAPLRSFFLRGRTSPPEHPFEAVSIETRWDVQRTLGDYRTQLRGAATSRDESTEQVLFNYFHGENLAVGSPGLLKWAELGRLLRAFGVPVVGYHTPLPIIRGEAHFPGEFTEHVRAKERLVEASLASELGELLHLVSLPPLDDADFIDAGDATEHLAQSGRRKVAKLVGHAVFAALEESPAIHPPR